MYKTKVILMLIFTLFFLKKKLIFTLIITDLFLFMRIKDNIKSL